MGEKEHRVHFGEDTETSGIDNEIVLKNAGPNMITAQLGFLKLGRKYEIKFVVPLTLCNFVDPKNLEVCNLTDIPNKNCCVRELSIEQESVCLTVDLVTYKEKLMKEDVRLTNSGQDKVFTIQLLARVLGRNKGTPLLRDGIRCIGVEPMDDDSEASDWQGF